MPAAGTAPTTTDGTSISRRMIVAEKRSVARDVVALTLVDPAGGALPPWSPGSHLDLEISPGIVRQYSLCGAADDVQQWTVAILREEQGRGGSRAIHDELSQGASVRVLAVRNKFCLEPADRYLFVAGGIGITPLVPMIAAAEQNQRPWRLYYGGRSRESMAFAHELTQRYGPNVVLHPEDEFGLLDLDAILATRSADQHVYCCGPGSLLAAVEQRFTAQTGHLLHVERFSAAAPTAQEIAQDRPIEVTLARTGSTVVVPADRNILDALREDHGMDLVSGCEQGICGTCETTVLAGDPDHRDEILTPEERAEGNTMMICVSRSTGDSLTLDL